MSPKVKMMKKNQKKKSKVIREEIKLLSKARSKTWTWSSISELPLCLALQVRARWSQTWVEHSCNLTAGLLSLEFPMHLSRLRVVMRRSRMSSLVTASHSNWTTATILWSSLTQLSSSPRISKDLGSNYSCIITLKIELSFTGSCTKKFTDTTELRFVSTTTELRWLQNWMSLVTKQKHLVRITLRKQFLR